MSKLVLVDGNAILHRAYHSMPATLTSRNGEQINAVYGFTSMLLTIISDLKPTHLAICFDRKEPTFRKEMYEKYQSQRPEMDKELSSQISIVKKVINAFAIPIFEKAGFEADDLIGTIAKTSEKTIDSVIIVTGDRDILQLVSAKTKVYLPIKGLTNAKLMGKNEVMEKLGVWPEQIIDYKALVGDPSDNYPGVPGIGPKTAEGLIDKYDNFGNIYKHLDEINDSVKLKLSSGKEKGDMSYKLAKIKTDVDIEIDLDEIGTWSINKKEILEVFSEIGFRSLSERVRRLQKDMTKTSQMTLV